MGIFIWLMVEYQQVTLGSLSLSADFSKLDHKFWCWSRRDVNEALLKEFSITTTLVEDYELQQLIFNQPFSVSYRFNGSHFQCNVDELWNDSWFDKIFDSTSPCVTNTSLPVNVKYHTQNHNL